MVDEQLDQEDQSEGAQGLGGELDLYAAVGVFGRVELDIFLDPASWTFRPEEGAV